MFVYIHWRDDSGTLLCVNYLEVNRQRDMLSMFQPTTHHKWLLGDSATLLPQDDSETGATHDQCDDKSGQR